MDNRKKLKISMLLFLVLVIGGILVGYFSAHAKSNFRDDFETNYNAHTPKFKTIEWKTSNAIPWITIILGAAIYLIFLGVGAKQLREDNIKGWPFITLIVLGTLTVAFVIYSRIIAITSENHGLAIKWVDGTSQADKDSIINPAWEANKSAITTTSIITVAVSLLKLVAMVAMLTFAKKIISERKEKEAEAALARQQAAWDQYHENNQ